MAANSKIEWTQHTFNPWIGCTKMHAGCTHCYAEADQDIRRGRAKWGPHGTRSRTSDANWREPLKWNRAAEKAGERHRVFCASLADVFEDWDGPIIAGGKQPVYLGKDGRASRGPADRMTMDDMRRDLFALIDATPHLDWLLLTKRPENVRRMWAISVHEVTRSGVHEGFLEQTYRPNVWLGTSISDQPTAEDWILRLLECRDLAPVLFLSAEPLIGPIDFDDLPFPVFAYDAYEDCLNKSGRVRVSAIDWVIVGGESGPHARTCDREWIQGIIDQCSEAGVPCFVKQLGARCVREHARRHADAGEAYLPHGYVIERPGSRLACHAGWFNFADKKGGDWSEWPEDLRVREFPTASVGADQ